MKEVKMFKVNERVIFSKSIKKTFGKDVEKLIEGTVVASAARNDTIVYKIDYLSSDKKDIETEWAKESSMAFLHNSVNDQDNYLRRLTEDEIEAKVTSRVKHIKDEKEAFEKGLKDRQDAIAKREKNADDFKYKLTQSYEEHKKACNDKVSEFVSSYKEDFKSLCQTAHDDYINMVNELRSDFENLLLSIDYPNPGNLECFINWAQSNIKSAYTIMKKYKHLESRIGWSVEMNYSIWDGKNVLKIAINGNTKKIDIDERSIKSAREWIITEIQCCRDTILKNEADNHDEEIRAWLAEDVKSNARKVIKKHSDMSVKDELMNNNDDIVLASQEAYMNAVQLLDDSMSAGSRL